MYISLLTKIKNAQSVGQTSIRFPYSRMDEEVLSVLQKEHFITAFEKKGKNPKRYFEIELAHPGAKKCINGVSFVSTPSRRIYSKKSGLRPVKQGYGLSIITTSQGIMTNLQAKKNNIGGQVLFNIW